MTFYQFFFLFSTYPFSLPACLRSYCSKSRVIFMQQLLWASNWYSMCCWYSDQGTRFDEIFSITILWFSVIFNSYFSSCQFLWALKLAGRSKNVWESPSGCLMFSFILQMEDGRVLPLVQYVVSLAITEAIKDMCDKNVSSLVLKYHLGI